MSYKIQATVLCDGENCPMQFESRIESRSTYAQQSVWEVKGMAERAGWSRISRGKFHTELHFCPSCSDKPMPANPKAKKQSTR